MSYLPSSVKEFLETPISLAKLELVIIELPQIKPFKSAIGVRHSREALIVKWYTSEGVIGYGECSCRPDPFYSHEFVNGAVSIVKDYIFPLIIEASSYKEVLTALNRVRGWNFTKAAVEYAMNDAIRRATGKGILDVWDRPRLNKVPVGISLGLFDDDNKMQEAIKESEMQGYTRLKFKINPSYTNSFVFNNLEACTHNNLSFDANGSFTEHDFDALSKFSELGYMIEQPFAPGNSFLISKFEVNDKLIQVCLDEEIETLGQLIEQKDNCNELNIKPGRVGGLSNTIEMIEYCFENDIPAWIGGMFETGIGRAQNLQIASFLVDAVAHDQSPSNRYFTKDVLHQPIEMDQGFISKAYFMNPEINEAVFDELTLKKIVVDK